MTKAKPYYCDWPVAEAGPGLCGRTDPKLFDDDDLAWSHSRCTEHRKEARAMTQLARDARNKIRLRRCDPRDIVLMRKPWLDNQKLAGERYIEWKQSR